MRDCRARSLLRFRGQVPIFNPHSFISLIARLAQAMSRSTQRFAGFRVRHARHQLFRKHGAVGGHKLPAAVVVHEHVRPPGLPADVLSLVRALVVAAICYDRRVTVYLHLGTV